MDLSERIARRISKRTENRLVVDWNALNPAYHSDPIGREALFEAVLDAINPVFEGNIPPHVYIWGKRGTGKSAITSSLFSTLDAELPNRRSILTTTRGESEREHIDFAYVDSRRASSQFQLYRNVLESLRTEPVPERGIGTDELESNIESELAVRKGIVVAVDHLGESNTVELDELYEFFDPFDDFAWVGVGRTPPDEPSLPTPDTTVHVPRYSYELVDILTVRGAKGLSRNLDHELAKRIADWADGNAHDALAALFVAAVFAEDDDQGRIRSEDVDRAMDEVPRDGISIGRLHGLSDSKQVVLRQLLQLSTTDASISTTADEIAARTDLTSSTVKRLLYELTQLGVLERTAVPIGDRMVGRQPSTVAPNFSSTLFEHLHER